MAKWHNDCYFQHRVKAIVDWKWKLNGDPLSDVANFTMMFLQPEEVGHRFRRLAGHELLLGMNMSYGVLYPDLIIAHSWYMHLIDCILQIGQNYILDHDCHHRHLVCKAIQYNYGLLL